MRRFCLNFSFLLAALALPLSANAQDTLKLNQTYRDVIRLDFPAGKTQIPLPEGEWELLGLQEDQSDLVTRIWRVYLAYVENNTLVGHIYIAINHDLPAGLGWSRSDLCDRDDLGFLEVKSNIDGAVDCWISGFARIRLKDSWPEGRKQMHNTLLSKGVTIPERMARVIFTRRSSDNLLNLAYYFHRYPLGRPIITREDIKTWGRKWKPKVDAGFLGKLEAFKTKEKSALPKQSPKAAPPAYKKV